MSTARETAKRSQDTITATQSVEGISAYKLMKITKPKDCCTGCGKKKHTDQVTFPAKDIVCPCGRTGHCQKEVLVVERRIMCGRIWGKLNYKFLSVDKTRASTLRYLP